MNSMVEHKFYAKNIENEDTLILRFPYNQEHFNKGQKVSYTRHYLRKQYMISNGNIPFHPEQGTTSLPLPSPCPEIRAIARERVHTREKFPARAKNRPCRHHFQPCNRICQIGTLLSQLQH